MRHGRSPKNPTRGFIVPIGGAENRVQNPVILRRFVKLCGGPSAHIAIIPTASSLDNTGDLYVSVFSDLNAGQISILPFKSREDCESQQYLEVLDHVDGVFMTGGDQVRLAEVLSGTSAAQKLCSRNMHGMHIAGTSAGASAMSSAMIAGGKSGATPRAGMVDLAAGLGLVSRFVIDQHFSQRDRLGRLLTAVASIPFGAGIGLDEDTAAFIGPDDTLEVVGTVVLPTLAILALILTPFINAAALSATATGNIDWACTSAGNKTATAQGLGAAALGTVPTKYVPSNCK